MTTKHWQHLFLVIMIWSWLKSGDFENGQNVENATIPHLCVLPNGSVQLGQYPFPYRTWCSEILGGISTVYFVMVLGAGYWGKRQFRWSPFCMVRRRARLREVITQAKRRRLSCNFSWCTPTYWDWLVPTEICSEGLWTLMNDDFCYLLNRQLLNLITNSSRCVSPQSSTPKGHNKRFRNPQNKLEGFPPWVEK